MKFTSKYYSQKEMFLRGLWLIIEPLFFTVSPRIFYGWRNFILRIMGADIGKNVIIYPSAKIMFPWLLKIGDNVVISWDVKIYNLGYSTIGRNSMISQYSHLCGGTHNYSTPDFDLVRSGFHIGNHVWIASDAFIGPGVTINDNAIVGARAVVVKDVGKGEIVAGNPARRINFLDTQNKS